MNQESRSAWRVPGLAWVLGALVAAYLALGWLFAYETQVRGLLSPGGAPNLDVVAVGCVYLLVRIAVRFGVPFMACLVAVRRIAAVLLEPARRRREGDP